MYESLHNHTIASDGKQTYAEVLATAEQHGVGTVAFTDHDILPNADQLRELKAYQGPVKWCIGIELSTELPIELGGAKTGSMHMLGLFVDPENEAILRYIERIETGRYERMQRIVRRLNEIGFDLSEQDCLDQSGGAAPGSLHIVTAVQAKSANMARMQVLKGELELAASSDERAAVLWQRVLGSGPAQLPFILYMKSDSYLPMPKPELGNDLIDFDEGAKLIREAGGIAMMAHWFFYERDFSRESLEAIMTAGRLDGVETAVVNSQNELDVSAGMAFLREMSDRIGTAQCLGIDAHYEKDFALFVDDANAKRSIGQTQRLIKRFQPDLAWSNMGQAHD